MAPLRDSKSFQKHIISRIPVKPIPMKTPISVVISLEEVASAFEYAATSLAARQFEEPGSSYVVEVLASEWCAQLLARQLGLNTMNEHYPHGGSLYDSVYHNYLIERGVDRWVLYRTRELLNQYSYIDLESTYSLRYAHRSLYFTSLTPFK